MRSGGREQGLIQVAHPLRLRGRVGGVHLLDGRRRGAAIRSIDISLKFVDQRLLIPYRAVLVVHLALHVIGIGRRGIELDSHGCDEMQTVVMISYTC